MQRAKSTVLLYFLLLSFILIISPLIARPTTYSTDLCGKIEIQTPFSLQSLKNNSSPFGQTLVCKSKKLYFRTSIGLFLVSSIDYKAKTLTISHSWCSSSFYYVSPKLLSGGFPTPQTNSLLLLNCLDHRKSPISSSLSNCSNSGFYGCKAVSRSLEKNPESQSSCWFIHDSEKLETGFDPKDLGCSHYARVYKTSNNGDDDSIGEGIELGTRISFDIPDKIPNLCDECKKPQGNCGVGLRCICHPKECKGKVISKGVFVGPSGIIFFSLLFFTVMMLFLV